MARASAMYGAEASPSGSSSADITARWTSSSAHDGPLAPMPLRKKETAYHDFIERRASLPAANASSVRSGSFAMNVVSASPQRSAQPASKQRVKATMPSSARRSMIALEERRLG